MIAIAPVQDKGTVIEGIIISFRNGLQRPKHIMPEAIYPYIRGQEVFTDIQPGIRAKCDSNTCFCPNEIENEGILVMSCRDPKPTLPRYQQIAVEIATRIASREYKEGQKIFARSSLASQYGVSAETARRAICVLADLDIVSSVKGSGVIIKTYESAEKFISQQQKRQSIEKIKSNILDCITRQKRDMNYLDDTLSELLSATEHFRSLNPFVPFQISIAENCAYLKKTIAEIRFWQNTGATVVAVERDNHTMISPGPYIQLLKGDTIYFVTDDSNPDAVNDFLYPES